MHDDGEEPDSTGEPDSDGEEPDSTGEPDATAAAEPRESEHAGSLAHAGEDEDPVLPVFVQELMASGLISDDLEVAEVAATAGPLYQLDELAVADVHRLCDGLDQAGAQWAIDRAGQLVVHRNDERRADAVFEEIFGPDEALLDHPDLRESRQEVEQMAAQFSESGPIGSSSAVPWLVMALVLAAVVVVVATLL